MQNVSLASVNSISFYQKPTTAERQGVAPGGDQLPAIIGFPNPPQRKLDDSEQLHQLELLFRERLKSSTPGEAASPVEVHSAPVTSSGTSSVTAASPAATQAAPSAPAPSGQPVELAFNNAPIDTVINTIMRELGYSYMIDPQVNGTVNLFTAGGVPREKLFEVLEQILKMNGLGIIKQDNFYLILPLSQTPKNPHEILLNPAAPPPEEGKGPEKSGEQKPQTGTAEAPPPMPGSSTEVISQAGPTVLRVTSSVQPRLQEEQGVLTYIIPLHYIPSDQAVELIKPFVSDGATVINFASANILIITDYRRNIQQVLNLVSVLDTQYFDVNTVDLIPIQYNQAKDVAQDLAKIFSPGDKAGGVRIVAVDRLNSILVVTHSPAVFREAKEWIDRLDAPSTSTNIKTFVYQVENNTAVNIAEILSQLYQDGVGLPSSPIAGAPASEGQQARQQSGLTPAQREAGFLPPSERGPQAGIRSELGPSLTGRPMSSQSGVRAVVSGNIKIIVNEFNNSLIIQATEADYQFLLQSIRQLDVLPRQVVIEAKIYSVELRDDLSFGVAAFLEKRTAEETIPDPSDPDKTIKVPLGPATTGQIGTPAQGSSGGALSLTTRAFIGMERQLELVINALRSKTNVQILEAPRLLTMDGMQATFNVGAEVPVTTSSFGDPIRGGGPNAFINSIQFRPTGTTLLIVPRISAGGIVTMDLAIEISSATGTALTPTINRNYVETSLIVKDGQTVAIAGIISDQFNVGKNRVPILGDIPILGAVFGQTTRNSRKNELVFFITPHVIRNLPTATELTLDFKRALRRTYDFIREKDGEIEQLIEKRRKKELEEESKEKQQP